MSTQTNEATEVAKNETKTTREKKLSTMSAFQITAALEIAYMQAVDEETGELVNDEAWENFKNLQMDLDEKKEQMVYMYKNFKFEAEAWAELKSRADKKKKIAEKKMERIKELIKFFVPEGEKFKKGLANVLWVESKSLEINNPLEIDPKWIKPHEIEYQKKEMTQAIKDGETIPGAELVIKSNIQIR